MRFLTAAQRGLQRLYHWQPFDKARLEMTLRAGTIYCSRPEDFNDPWDCKPYFNTDLLDDPRERKKHIEWAVRICREQGTTSEQVIALRQRQLQDPTVLKRFVNQHTEAMQHVRSGFYRVYCMCPDVLNVLLWAHYANKHTGICLEFDVANRTICGALEVQYRHEFPMTRQYSNDLDENLLPFIAKSDVWLYEQEYRLIAQEVEKATPDETLMTNGGHLKLADGALQAIVVGCQGPYDLVQDLVQKHNPEIQVLRAQLVPNRYAVSITM